MNATPEFFDNEKIEHEDAEPDSDCIESDEPESVAISEESVLQTLREGEMETAGLLPYSSNHSFLVTISAAELALPAVYKPRRGENPLWDFTSGTLCSREAAAYVVCSQLGWRLVPPTVLRDGPHGFGSVQFFIDHDQNEHYFTIQYDARFTDSLRQLVLFDYVINNADRKSGHCLAGADDQLWAIDHGICFHTEHKLRSVIWEFSEEPIQAELLADLVRFRIAFTKKESKAATQLAELLSAEEYSALTNRLDKLIQSACYPSPSPFQRNYPWPPV